MLESELSDPCNIRYSIFNNWLFAINPCQVEEWRAVILPPSCGQHPMDDSASLRVWLCNWVYDLTQSKVISAGEASDQVSQPMVPRSIRPGVQHYQTNRELPRAMLEQPSKFRGFIFGGWRESSQVSDPTRGGTQIGETLLMMRSKCKWVDSPAWAGWTAGLLSQGDPHYVLWNKAYTKQTCHEYHTWMIVWNQQKLTPAGNLKPPWLGVVLE